MAGFVGRSVRVVKGRKVPIGTVGNCFWSDWTKWGLKVGLITADGTKYFTAASNVVLETPVEEESYSPFETPERGPGLDSDDPGPVVEPPKAGKLKWGEKEVKETKQTAYYDITVYKVPVDGAIDTGRIMKALNEKYPQKSNTFGGYSTIERVEKVPNENAVEVAMYYHIGD